MKVTKTSSVPAVSSTTEKQSKAANVVENQASSSNRNSQNLSSQMQLLTLAKQFALDGGLLPVDKQMPLADRCEKRSRSSYFRKQQNLESIIQKSLSYCSGDEVSNRADQDWFYSFTELAENISNKTMQDLWAKILAGEISSPGSFSLKSLQAFKTMSLHDAKLLAKACKVAVQDQHKVGLRIISSASQTPGLLNIFSGPKQQQVHLANFGLNYTELMTLADNHLIFIQETETLPLNKGESLQFIYGGQALNLTPDANGSVLSFYKFTPIGNELAQLISDMTDDKYLPTLKHSLEGIFSVN